MPSQVRGVGSVGGVFSMLTLSQCCWQLGGPGYGNHNRTGGAKLIRGGRGTTGIATFTHPNLKLVPKFREHAVVLHDSEGYVCEAECKFQVDGNGRAFPVVT